MVPTTSGVCTGVDSEEEPGWPSALGVRARAV